MSTRKKSSAPTPAKPARRRKITLTLPHVPVPLLDGLTGFLAAALLAVVCLLGSRGCDGVPSPFAPSVRPIPAGQMRALMVYESGDLSTMPREQKAVLFSPDVRGFLKGHCSVGPDGKTADYRVYDQHQPVASDDAFWRDAMARPRASVPWLTLFDGEKAAYDGPLPASVAAMMDLLHKHGG